MMSRVFVAEGLFTGIDLTLGSLGFNSGWKNPKFPGFSNYLRLSDLA